MPIEQFDAEVNEVDRAIVYAAITAAVIAKSGDDAPKIEPFGATFYDGRWTMHFVAIVHHTVFRGRVGWQWNRVSDLELDEVASRADAIATSTTRVRVVRCPLCGSTNAGETEGAYEFAIMTCQSCSHQSGYIDSEQIKDEWNATIEIPYDANALPPFVPVG